MRTSLCFSLMSYGGSYDFFRPFDKEIVSSECKKLNGRIYVNLKPRTYDCRDVNLQEKKKTLPLSGTSNRLTHFSLCPARRIGRPATDRKLLGCTTCYSRSRP